MIILANLIFLTLIFTPVAETKSCNIDEMQEFREIYKFYEVPRSEDISEKSKSLDVCLLIDDKYVTIFGELFGSVNDLEKAVLQYQAAIWKGVSISYSFAGINIKVIKALIQYNSTQNIFKPIYEYENDAGRKKEVLQIFDSLQEFENYMEDKELIGACDAWFYITSTAYSDNYAGTTLDGLCSENKFALLNDNLKPEIIGMYAHELAHLLNARHDGDQGNAKQCKADEGFIMGIGEKNKFKFSECSKQAILKALNEKQCIKSTSYNQSIFTYMKIDPSFPKSFTEQCQKILTNNNATVIYENSNICKNFGCEVKHEYSMRNISPYEGTSCNNSSGRCIAGSCLLENGFDF